MSGFCALLCFKPNDNDHSWLCSGWVAVVPCCVSSLVTMPVLASLVCEWLLCLTVFQAWWQCLSVTLQEVSGCCALMCFQSADNDCSLVWSLWVADLPHHILSLLIISVLGSSACEWLMSHCVLNLLIRPVLVCPAGGWLPCLTVFKVCWWQIFRMWVATCLSVFYSYWSPLPLALHWSHSSLPTSMCAFSFF